MESANSIVQVSRVDILVDVSTQNDHFVLMDCGVPLLRDVALHFFYFFVWTVIREIRFLRVSEI